MEFKDPNEISAKRCFIMAELAQAHDGSLGILHSYIDALAETGVDAIKFQTHLAEAESSDFEQFRVNFSYEDKTRFDYWKRMEFSAEQWKGIKQHCEDKKVEFISSPFSNAAVDLLEQLDVKTYKIGSGEVSNFLMLEKIAGTGKPIILSSGMSSWDELDKTIAFLKKFQNPLSILQCNTEYPTPAEHLGLNVIPVMKARYHIPVGLSDHSGSIYPSIAAVAMGASLLEFHAVFDKRLFGPDASSSLLIDEIKELVKGVRLIEKSIYNPVDKNNIDRFQNVKSIFEKSLAVNKDIPAGYTIQFEDLESKKPSGYGIAATDFRSVIGKRTTKDLKKYSFLNQNDIE